MTRFDYIWPFAVLFVLLIVSAVASASDGEKKKPAPPIVVKPAVISTPAQAAPDNDRKADNLYVAVPVAAALTAHFRSEPYGALKAIGITTLGAAVVEAGHSGSYNGSNVWYAFAGATVGSIGTCQLFFRKGFTGCVFEFR